MAETTTFPFDPTTSPKGQPRLSPYASGPVWLSFGPAAPPHLIPQALIPPSILCNSRHLGDRAAYELPGQSATPFVCVHDVDADVAHTFVHYLHTGEYQTLNSPTSRDHPGGSNEEKSREHRRALLAYVAATVHQLEGLRRLARDQAEAMEQMLPPWVVLHDVESAYEGLRERDNWLDGHMTDAIRKYVTGGKIDRDQQLDKGLKSIFSCSILDAVGEVFSHGMVQGGNDSLEIPMAPGSVNVEDENEAYCSELSSDAEVIELDPSLTSGSEKTHWLVGDELEEPVPCSEQSPQSPDLSTPGSDQMTMLERPSLSASPRAPGSTTNISSSVFLKTRHRLSHEHRVVDSEHSKLSALPPHIIEIPYRPSPASPLLPPPPPPEIPGVQIVAVEDNRRKNGSSAEPTMDYEEIAGNIQANSAPRSQAEQPPMLPMPSHNPSPQDRTLGFIRWTHPELTERLSKDDKPGIEGPALEKRKYRKKKSTKRPRSSIVPRTDCWFPAPPGPHLSHPMPPLGPFPTMRRNFPIKNSPPPPPPLRVEPMVGILPPPPPPPPTQPMTTPPPPPPAPVPPPVAYFSYPSDSHMPPPPPPDPQPDNMSIPKLSPNPYKTMLLPPMPPTGPPPPPPPPLVPPPNPPSTVASSEMTGDVGGDDHGGATCARMSAHLAGRGWRRCDQCRALVMLATQVARSQQREEAEDEDEGEMSEDDGEHHGYETSSVMSDP